MPKKPQLKSVVPSKKPEQRPQGWERGRAGFDSQAAEKFGDHHPPLEMEINGLGTMSRIREELFQLERSISGLRESDTDLADKIETLDTSLTTLQESIDNLAEVAKEILEQLKRKADDAKDTHGDEE